MDELKSIAGIYKKIIIIGIIIASISIPLFIATFGSKYNQNIFEVTINNQEMSCYSDETNYNFFSRLGEEEWHYDKADVNEITLEDKMLLNLKEYEVYKKGKRKQSNNIWEKQSDYEYKEVRNSIKLEIKRKGKVLYKGEFIEDISKYLNEKGRYYIHLYNTRDDGFLKKTETHISFNVIVGGGNINE